MAIKAVIFDCFGVLVISARDLLLQRYPQFADQITDIGHQSDYGMISRRKFDENIAQIIGTTPEDVEAKYWADSVRNEKAFDWIRDLKASGKYKIGVLSNIGHGWFNDFMPIAEQKELFDEVILSADEGMIKPEVAIYNLTAERLGVPIGECVMIDDRQLNIDGAQQAGMQTVLFGSVDQAKDEFMELLKENSA